MSLVAKGGLTAAVLAVGCAGTYFLMTSEGSGPITLQKEEGTPEATYNNKIGVDFKYFLVSPFNKRNEKFWKEAHERLDKAADDTNRSDEFKKTSKVVSAFTEDKTGTDNGKDKALNRVCYDLYKGKAKSDLDLTDNTKKKLTTDLFTYCSVLGGLPTVIQSPTANTIGKTNETKLISTEGNDVWWNLKHKEFVHSTLTDSEKFFKKFHGEAKGNKASSTLRSRCKEAYAKTVSNSSGDETPTSAEALKYCSLLGS